MKKVVTGIGVSCMLLSGCANKEALNHYYDVELTRTTLLIESAEKQATENANMRIHQMQAFSAAASTAAKTPDNTDDALLAFAWGFQMGQPMKVEIPKLQSLKAPDTDADMVRAWTPVLGIIAPFLYPLTYGWANNSDDGGTSYYADNGGSVVVGSGNPGSYNSVGGDFAATNTQSDFSLVDNSTCDNCGPDGEEPLDPTIDPTIDPIGDELCSEGNQWINPVTGRTYTDSTETCSCSSRAAGNC